LKKAGSVFVFTARFVLLFLEQCLIYRENERYLSKYLQGNNSETCTVGQRQQEELLARQEQIRQAHDHLFQNSHSTLEAQVPIHFVHPKKFE
jgi:hypothetical protein